MTYDSWFLVPVVPVAPVVPVPPYIPHRYIPTFLARPGSPTPRIEIPPPLVLARRAVGSAVDRPVRVRPAVRERVERQVLDAHGSAARAGVHRETGLRINADADAAARCRQHHVARGRTNVAHVDAAAARVGAETAEHPSNADAAAGRVELEIGVTAVGGYGTAARVGAHGCGPVAVNRDAARRSCRDPARRRAER